MSSGLFSSLALSSGVASSIIMGVQPPPAPTIPEQSIVQSDDIDSDAQVSSDNRRSALSSSLSQDNASSASRILTGDEDTLKNISQPHGIDISSHQHNGTRINLPKVIDGGQDFVFVKATEGTSYINPYFRSDVISAMDKNTPVGFYHYARPSSSSDDARKQAQYFVSTTGIDKGVKSLPPVLDIEENNGVRNSDDLINWTHAFVDEVKSLTGKDVMIYTYPSFWKNSMKNTEEFNHLPLWIANYNGLTSLEKPLIGGWDEWTFWQYSADGDIDGYPKEIDVNLFNGTEEELTELYDFSQSQDSSQKPSRPTVTKTVIVQE